MRPASLSYGAERLLDVPTMRALTSQKTVIPRRLPRCPIPEGAAVIPVHDTITPPPEEGAAASSPVFPNSTLDIAAPMLP